MTTNGGELHWLFQWLPTPAEPWVTILIIVGGFLMLYGILPNRVWPWLGRSLVAMHKWWMT